MDHCLKKCFQIVEAEMGNVNVPEKLSKSKWNIDSSWSLNPNSNVNSDP